MQVGYVAVGGQTTGKRVLAAARAKYQNAHGRELNGSGWPSRRPAAQTSMQRSYQVAELQRLVPARTDPDRGDRSANHVLQREHVGAGVGWQLGQRPGL